MLLVLSLSTSYRVVLVSLVSSVARHIVGFVGFTVDVHAMHVDKSKQDKYSEIRKKLCGNSFNVQSLSTSPIRRRRRRCGPPVGRPRGTSPWCPQALHVLVCDREGGFTPTRLAKHHGGGSPRRLLPLFPGLCHVHEPALHVARSPPRGKELGARQSPGSTSGTVHDPPKGRGTQSHGCGPLAHQVLPTGRRLAGGSRGLGPWPGPPPSPGARHFCRRRSCAGPSTTLPTAATLSRRFTPLAHTWVQA